MWTTSKQWISGKLNKILKLSQETKSTLDPKPSIQSKTLQRVPLQKKKEMFFNKIRGNNINSQISSRLKRIYDYYSQNNNQEKPFQLVCPICIELFSLPITTICGHTFCQNCLDQHLLSKQCCPVCRTAIRGSQLFSCQALSDIVKRYSEKCLGDYQKEAYQKAFNQTIQWKNNRNLCYQQLHINDMIDAQDTQFIWCQAQIKDILTKDGIIHSLMIHYKGWNTIYDEVIDLTSRRLAKHGFYTSRKNIPQYRMDQSNPESMHNYVISGSHHEDLAAYIENMVEQLMNTEDQDIAHQISLLSNDNLEEDSISLQNQLNEISIQNPQEEYAAQNMFNFMNLELEQQNYQENNEQKF